MRVIKAAKAKSTNARGEAKLDPELVLGGALAVEVPLVVVAVLEADPIFKLDMLTVGFFEGCLPLVVVLPVRVEDALEDVIVEFEAAVADADEDAEEPVEVDDPDAELEEAGPPVISKRTL